MKKTLSALGALSVFSGIVFSDGASASTYEMIFQGVVYSGGFDSADLFGGGYILAGANFTATYLYNPNQGSVTTSNLAYGGIGYYPRSLSPILDASITINGLTANIAGNDNSWNGYLMATGSIIEADFCPVYEGGCTQRLLIHDDGGGPPTLTYFGNFLLEADRTGQFIGVGINGLEDSFGLAATSVELTEPTPLPAALPLFATGLGALGLFGWRRKRKAQAAA